MKIPKLGSLSFGCFILTILVVPYICNGDMDAGCRDCEREALIGFRKSLRDPFNRLSSWDENLNCCKWRGVVCDDKTGYVIRLDLRNHYDHLLEADVSKYGYWNLSGILDPILVELEQLRYLDLSQNSFTGIPIPDFLGSFKELRYLNLSYAGFYGKIPSQLGNLSNLEYMSISSNVLNVESLNWAENLHYLQLLEMNYVNLSQASHGWIKVLNRLPLIRKVHLRSCGLSYIPPSLSFINFTTLQYFDVSSNVIRSEFPHWIASITTLESLDLSNNRLEGSVPYKLSELPNLQILQLEGNFELNGTCSDLFQGSWRKIKVLGLSAIKLGGQIPRSVGNITSLVELHLSVNEITGMIPETISSLDQLKFLSLSGNRINGGPMLNWLCSMKNLQYLFLQHCLLTGLIPSCLGNLSSLRILDLRSNQLSGVVPTSIGKLTQLAILDISSNSLDGIISETHVSELSNLRSLDMSNNSLKLQLEPKWVPPFQLEKVSLSSCDLGPTFPEWLKSQNNVGHLDLSNALISSAIPSWIWDLSPQLYYLNLASNMMTGVWQNYSAVKGLSFVNMSSNLFYGPIPTMFPDAHFLDLSHNHFSGPLPVHMGHDMPKLAFFSASYNHICGNIPLSIEDMKKLWSLDLSNNKISGEIPSTIGNCTKLRIIDLSGNCLHGEIPSSLGLLDQLKVLQLNNNSLSGDLPLSLSNCSWLNILDLGENQFSGIVPPWIGESYKFLRLLRLQSNMFTGKIPPQLFELIWLHVLDLANNRLSGSIPPNFRKLFFMTYSGKLASDFTITNWDYFIDGKHILPYSKTIYLVKRLDLSSNTLSGGIPDGLTMLSGLRVLNLSWNSLVGHIPEYISNFQVMSSLDLSNNRLSGPIPQSLLALTSLAHLNLSYNNLSGRIAANPQLETLMDPSVYIGNDGLCGLPITEDCPEDGSSERDGMTWFDFLRPDLSTVFQFIFALLMFDDPLRHAVFQFFEELVKKLRVVFV